MARTPSSDAPDQRPTELLILGDEWLELDETVRGPLLPPASAPLRIVMGKPIIYLTDEIALREVVDVLGSALDEVTLDFQTRDRSRWWLVLGLGAVLAATPIEPLTFLLEQAIDLSAAVLLLTAETVSSLVR
jgi:hypothetical protein